MRTKTKVKIIISVFILLMILYIALDYFNIMSKISINIDRININMLSLFLTNLIVICLYLITYLVIDSKNEKERNNKKQIVKYMLDEDYKTCLRYLEALENKEQLNLIVQKLNTDSYLYKNDYFNNLMAVAFKNYNDIMQYSIQGIIDVEILKRYLFIKSNYSNTISGYVLAKDMPKQIEKIIEEGQQNLKLEIQKAIGNVKKIYF